MQSKSGQYYKTRRLIVLIFMLVAGILLLFFTEHINLPKPKPRVRNKVTLNKQPSIRFVKPKLPTRLLHKNASLRRRRRYGEMGRAVVIPLDKQADAKNMFQLNQLNVVASDMISVNRSLPDIRSNTCQSKVYPPSEELPSASVVIVFHNEANSTLLRTIHSVINRSPRGNLKEIILVDDASNRDYLGSPLDEYMTKLKIPIIIDRMTIRSGLIRARLRGAERATGDVIVFLDAHCECAIGWLEPLLYEIQKDRRNIVCPVIDNISDMTFEYTSGFDTTVGGFDKRLNFRWQPASLHEMEKRVNDRSLPLRSPVMAGGLFAVERKYFFEIGSYDSGMDVWGGENIEMSFRVWMCGGQLLIVPCSHVGHVYRKLAAYSFPGGRQNVLRRNKLRVAHVWMDEWEDVISRTLSDGGNQTSYDMGDVSARKDLRQKLGCKSFHWYLNTVYPNSPLLQHSQLSVNVNSEHYI